MALSTDNKSSRLFKAQMGVSETKTTRDFFEEPVLTFSPILPNRVWKYGDWIPTGSTNDLAGPNAILAIQALVTDQETFNAQVDEGTAIPLVKRWIRRQFTAIDAGTNNAFKLLDTENNPLQNIIPFNFGDGTSYNYNLYKSDGSVIAFGVGDWVFDPASGVLTFYNMAAISGVDATHPPRMSFFQYVGGTGLDASATAGAYDGVILPTAGFNGGTNTSTWFGASLNNLIIAATDALEAGFVDTYGWDGSDTSEGVAVSYQKLIPLIYANTKDPVKAGTGVDASAVMSLISRKAAATRSILSGLIIDFVSQGITTEVDMVQIRYTDGAVELSLDAAATWGPVVYGIDTLGFQEAVKITNGSEFVVLRRIAGALPTNGATVIEIIDTLTSVGLFAWSVSTLDYAPYVNPDGASLFQFGVPIVLRSGKIPPSFKLGSSSYGSTDPITPQYYGGTHAISAIVSVQDSAEPTNSTVNYGDAADYVVTNTAGAFLDDIITSIYNAYPGFTGEILLRNGRYKCNGDLTFNDRLGMKLRGETGGSVFVDNNGTTRTITIQDGGTDNNVYLSDLVFSGTFNVVVSQLDVNIPTLYMKDCVGANVSFTVADNCGIVLSGCNSLRDLIISGPSSATTPRIIENSALNILTLDGENITVRNSVIHELIGNTGAVYNDIIGCQIDLVTSLDTNNQYIGNSVTTFGGSIDDKFEIAPQKIETVDADGVTRRWASFAAPFIWVTETNSFELDLDSNTLGLDISNQLTVINSAFDNTGVTRADGTAVSETDVRSALVDIYGNKADLDTSGKIPLTQIPDSIVEGGILYKGMWSLADHSGAYPTNTDLGETLDLQNGWFVIISPSSDPINPAAPQLASDGKSYTAGDWAIYINAEPPRWDKVDNSFADASYAILPTNPPDSAWSDGLLSLGGTTLVEATDQINEILAKLAPTKPANLSDMVLTLKETPYTAAESGTGTVRTSLVIDNVRPEATTPTGVNSISTLFFDGDNGILTAYIDTSDSGDPAGQIVLSSASDVGVNGALSIIADADPWAGIMGQANFWKGLRAEIVPTVNLALGVHTYSLEHTVSGATPNLTVYIDNPAIITSISGVTVTSNPAMNTYISGVPSVAASAQFGLSSGTAVGVVGKFYNNTRIATLTCNVSGVTSQNLVAASIPTAPIDGLYGDASFNASTVTMSTNGYSENITLTITPYNSKDVAGAPTIIPSGYRIDTTTETERVESGDGTDKYPVISLVSPGCGATYTSTASLVDTYSAELQKINGVYTWPAGDYTSYGGPDYSTATGNSLSGETGTWRWVTLFFSAAVSNTSALTLTFDDATGFTADANQITADMLMYLRVNGTSGTEWIDINSPYPGSGTPYTNGEAAMVAGESTATEKRVTFGTSVRTGDVYVRIAIRAGSNIEFGGVTLSDLT